MLLKNSQVNKQMGNSLAKCENNGHNGVNRKICAKKLSAQAQGTHIIVCNFSFLVFLKNSHMEQDEKETRVKKYQLVIGTFSFANIPAKKAQRKWSLLPI